MEEWRDIPGYENRYQVSDMGNVRGLTRAYAITDKRGHSYTREYPGKVLKQCVGSNGYQYVGLRKDRDSKNATYCPVHHLVAAAFLGERPEKYEVCHRDGDKSNNKLSNLRYDTRRENCLDIYRAGRKSGKLTMEQARIVKQRIKAGEKNGPIAKDFGVTWQAIDAIRRGVRFSWLE